MVPHQEDFRGVDGVPVNDRRQVSGSQRTVRGGREWGLIRFKVEPIEDSEDTTDIQLE